MKKRFFVLVAFIVIAAMAMSACSGGQTATDGGDDGGDGGEKVIDHDGFVEGGDVTLESMNGWWYLIEDYPSADAVPMKIFRLDAASESWYLYDESEGESYAGKAGITEEGKLFLGFEQGDMLYTYEDNQFLWDDDGNIVFCAFWGPEETIPGADARPVVLEGKWFQNGDTSKTYYLFGDREYKKVSPGADPSALNGEQYALRDTEYVRQDAKTVSAYAIDFDDPNAVDLCILSDDYSYFYVFGKDEYYLREDVAGTPRGDEIACEFRTVSETWLRIYDGGYDKLDFCEGGLFILEFYKGEEDSMLVDSGRWSLSGDSLTLVFWDGESQTLPFAEDVKSMTVERYQRTFTLNGE